MVLMVTASKCLLLCLIIWSKVRLYATSYVSVACDKNCHLKDGTVAGEEANDIQLKVTINSTSFVMVQMNYQQTLVLTLKPDGQIMRNPDPGVPSFIDLRNTTSVKTNIGYNFSFKVLKLNRSMQETEFSYTITLADSSATTKKFKMDILFMAKVLSGSGLNSTYNVSETNGTAIKLHVQMTGNPKPSVTVGFSDRDFAVNSSTKGDVYNYFVDIGNITRDQCRKTLTLTYQNLQRLIQTQNATMYVFFAPEAPIAEKTNVNKTSKCATIQWNKIRSGYCLVGYTIEYTIYIKNNTIKELISMNASASLKVQHTRCFNRSAHEANVSVKASVNGQLGPFSWPPLNIDLTDSDKPTVKPDPKPISKGGLSGGSIAGIIIVVILIAVVAGVLFVKRRVLRQFIDNRVNGSDQ